MSGSVAVDGYVEGRGVVLANGCWCDQRLTSSYIPAPLMWSATTTAANTDTRTQHTDELSVDS